MTEKPNNFLPFPSTTLDYGNPGFYWYTRISYIESCQLYSHLASSDLAMNITRLPPAKCPFKTPEEIQELTAASISSSFSIL